MIDSVFSFKMFFIFMFCCFYYSLMWGFVVCHIRLREINRNIKMSISILAENFNATGLTSSKKYLKNHFGIQQIKVWFDFIFKMGFRRIPTILHLLFCKKQKWFASRTNQIFVRFFSILCGFFFFLLCFEQLIKCCFFLH